MLPKHITDESKDGEIKYVSSGQIITGSKDEILTSSPLGSCVAVVAYDIKNRVGGMAHIMLPGKSKNQKEHKNKYADNALENLLSEMNLLGAEKSKIEICLAGGANVLQKQDDTIAKANVSSVINTINEKNLTLCATSLGGFERRSIRVNIQTGTVCCTIGNSTLQPFSKFGIPHQIKTHLNRPSENSKL